MKCLGDMVSSQVTAKVHRIDRLEGRWKKSMFVLDILVLNKQKKQRA